MASKRFLNLASQYMKALRKVEEAQTLKAKTILKKCEDFFAKVNAFEKNKNR